MKSALVAVISQPAVAECPSSNLVLYWPEECRLPFPALTARHYVPTLPGCAGRRLSFVAQTTPLHRLIKYRSVRFYPDDKGLAVRAANGKGNSFAFLRNQDVALFTVRDGAVCEQEYLTLEELAGSDADTDQVTGTKVHGRLWYLRRTARRDLPGTGERE
jgi:hypothetical protein